MKNSKVKRFDSGIVFLTILFFLPVLFFTWEHIAPFVQADDWRFITLYLKPLFNGELQLKNLWSDHVHPQPVYALFFIGSAKYFNLQMEFIGRPAIFFQLFIGLLVAFSFVKSLKRNAPKLLLILGVVSLNSIVFSFIENTPYTWPIMTFIFMGTFLCLLVIFLADKYYHQANDLDLKKLIIIGITIITAYLLYSDWALIFCFSLLIILAIIFIVEKSQRSKILYLSSVIIVSLALSVFLLRFFLLETPRGVNGNSSIIEFFSMWFNNPLLMLKSIGVALFSGLVNFRWFDDTFEGSTDLYIILSLLFLISYLFVFILMLTKKLYQQSLIPVVMMVYAFVFAVSVLFFRYNPVDDGVFCLYWSRYVQYYQVGIIGYLWSLFLLISVFLKKNPGYKRKLLIISYMVTFILLLFWSVDYYYINRTISEWLKVEYAGISADLRNKLEGDEVKLPGLARSVNWDIKPELMFLKEHKLNLFAPNYPYPELDEKKVRP